MMHGEGTVELTGFGDVETKIKTHRAQSLRAFPKRREIEHGEEGTALKGSSRAITNILPQVQYPSGNNMNL